MPPRRPDFLIIGAMKCATTTLHGQLAAQPGVFMPGKDDEPNFFSDDHRYARGAAWYEGLFAAAGPDDLVGEASTHYTKLPTYPKCVARLRDWFGDDIRLIYQMRHPLDRLVSQYIHEWSEAWISVSIDDAIDRHLRLIHYSRYAMQLEPYLQTFGADRVLPMFFERLVAHPQAELERVGAFLGLSERPVWQADKDAANQSAARVRQGPVRRFLIRNRAMTALRRALVPQAMRDHFKKRWTLGERPRLSAPVEARVRAVLDDDLSQLGRWLGVDDLSCDTFPARIADRRLEWSAPPAREHVPTAAVHAH